MALVQAQDPILLTRCERLVPYLWPLVLGITLILGALSWQNYRWHRESITEQNRTTLSQHAQQGLKMLDVVLTQYTQQLEDSVRLLAKGDLLRQFSRSRSEQARATIEQQWKLLAENSEHYTQIRFLDNQGMEQIRVNFDPGSGRSSVADTLQHKGHRPYMQLARTLGDDEIAIAAFDLEAEFGKLVTPYQVAGRVIAPVVFEQQRRGYVLMNLQMNKLFEILSQHQQISGVSLETLTSGGFFIRSRQPEQAFGHLLPSREQYQLKNTAPGLWREVQRANSGIFPEGEALSVYRWIDISGGNRRVADAYGRILLLSHVSEEMILNASQDALDAANASWQLRAVMILLFSLLAGVWLRRWLIKVKTQKLMLSAVSRMSAVTLTDNTGRLIGINQAFTDVTGFTAEELIGKTASVLRPMGDAKIAHLKMQQALLSNGRWQGEMQGLAKDGRTMHVWIETSAIKSRPRSTEADYYVSNFIDITERKRLESQLRELSVTDALTGAFNRRRFDEELHRLNKLAQRYPQNPFCLALIDLDHFKSINDSFGHTAGDLVLMQFVESLKAMLRETDFLARLGGEEFAVLLPNTDMPQGLLVAERMRIQVKEAFSNPAITCSVGLVANNGKLGATEMYSHADACMYEAKALGRDRVIASSLADKQAPEQSAPEYMPTALEI